MNIGTRKDFAGKANRHSSLRKSLAVAGILGGLFLASCGGGTNGSVGGGKRGGLFVGCVGRSHSPLGSDDHRGKHANPDDQRDALCPTQRRSDPRRPDERDHLHGKGNDIRFHDHGNARLLRAKSVLHKRFLHRDAERLIDLRVLYDPGREPPKLHDRGVDSFVSIDNPHRQSPSTIRHSLFRQVAAPIQAPPEWEFIMERWSCVRREDPDHQDPI